VHRRRARTLSEGVYADFGAAAPADESDTEDESGTDDGSSGDGAVGVEQRWGGERSLADDRAEGGGSDGGGGGHIDGPGPRGAAAAPSILASKAASTGGAGARPVQLQLCSPDGAARLAEWQARAVASFSAAVLTEIYLCNVCSCQERLRHHGGGQGCSAVGDSQFRAHKLGGAGPLVQQQQHRPRGDRAQPLQRTWSGAAATMSGAERGVCLFWRPC
jgi:hypothetical protein